MAAIALITDPAVVVFDEPTTALDVTTQIEVLAAFKRVIRELGTTAGRHLREAADCGETRGLNASTNTALSSMSTRSVVRSCRAARLSRQGAIVRARA